MKELPYYTLFMMQEDTDASRRALGKYLRARAQEGWPVTASDAEEPVDGVVHHVSADDLPAPPDGVTADLREAAPDAHADTKMGSDL